MKTLLLIWSLVTGHCFAGPFFFGQQGAVANQSSDPALPTVTSGTLLSDYNPGLLSGAVGDAVSSLTDSVGGFDLSQSTSSKRPTIQSGPNGRKVLQFDKIDDSLDRTASVPSFTAVTLFVVASWGAGDQWLFSYSNSGSGDDRGLNILGSTTARMAAYSNPFFPSVNATVSTSTWTILTGQHNNSGTARIRVNSGSETTASAGTTPAMNRINLGHVVWVYGDQYPLGGSVARILVFSGVLNSTDIAAVVSYLDTLY